MPEFRRGAAAIEAAAQAAKSGGFKGFVPTIRWQEDKEERYVLFLTPLEEIVTVAYHDWIPVGTRKNSDGEKKTIYEEFISRKELGEDYDDIEDRLGRKSKERSIGIAVELEPVFETVRGRRKPTSFAVKTDTYNRKDEDEGTIEVTQPVIGLVVQAQSNFYNWISSFDQNDAPITETPVKITRSGKDANTTYLFVPFNDMEVDFGPLLENVDGLSYLSEDMEELQESIGDMEPEEAAAFIAAALLDKRLEELSDEERYSKLVDPIEELDDPFGGKKKSGEAKKNGARRRPARKSQREATDDEPQDAPDEEPEEPKAKKAARGKKMNPRFAKLREEVEAKAKGK